MEVTPSSPAVQVRGTASLRGTWLWPATRVRQRLALHRREEPSGAGRGGGKVEPVDVAPDGDEAVVPALPVLDVLRVEGTRRLVKCVFKLVYFTTSGCSCMSVSLHICTGTTKLV